MNTLSPLMARKALGTIAIIAIAMWSFGYGIWTPTANAVALTVVSDTLSDSDLGVLSDHEIVFSSATGVSETQTIELTFAGEFNVSTSSIDFNDIDVQHEGGGDLQLAAACGGGGDQVGVAVAGQTITLTICSGQGGALAAGGTTTIQIGENATGGAANDQMVNPAEAGSYLVQIGGTMTDSGETRVAIIDEVVVTASVDTTFVFTINGMPQGYTVNLSPTTTAAASTATTLPFGTITPETSNTLAQNITVTTNAANGFTVTVNQDQNLTSTTGADIDSFIDGAGTASSTAWVPPSANLGTGEATYGHMAITSEDETPSANSEGFFDNLWAGNFVNNAREVFYHDGPADGVTADVGSTTVGFQVGVSALQEAGNDYTANITYVATPVF